MMLTSAGQRGDAARCRELGLEGYLTKPVSQSELLDAVLRVAGPKRPAAKPALVTRHSLREEGRSLRILLAEDNAVNQLLASRLLENQGHNVVTAGNGRAALERLEKETFDLILMDIQMPEIDGFEATAAIRKKEESTGKHLPIIAMTAHAMEGDRERCLAAGMDGYISKPIKAEDLIDAIENLGRSPAVAEAATPAKPREQEPIDTASALARVGGERRTSEGDGGFVPEGTSRSADTTFARPSRRGMPRPLNAPPTSSRDPWAISLLIRRSRRL